MEIFKNDFLLCHTQAPGTMAVPVLGSRCYHDPLLIICGLVSNHCPATSSSTALAAQRSPKPSGDSGRAQTQLLRGRFKKKKKKKDAGPRGLLRVARGHMLTGGKNQIWVGERSQRKDCRLESGEATLSFSTEQDNQSDAFSGCIRKI